VPALLNNPRVPAPGSGHIHPQARTLAAPLRSVRLRAQSRDRDVMTLVWMHPHAASGVPRNMGKLAK